MFEEFFRRVNDRLRPGTSTVGRKLDQFFTSITQQTADQLANSLLGSGSESLVFKLESSDKQAGRATAGIVLKAIIDRTIKYLDEDTPPTLEYVKFLRNELEAEKETMEKEYVLLRQAFGDAVLKTRFRVVDVSLSREQVERYRPKWSHGIQRIPKRIPLLLAVQRRVFWGEDYLKVQGNINLSRDFFLHSHEDLQREFTQAYECILYTPEKDVRNEGKNMESRRTVVYRVYPDIRYVMDKINIYEKQGDRAIRPAYIQAIRSLIRFVNVSRIPLDIAGNNNIILQKDAEGKGWKLRLIDPLPIGRERLDELTQAIRSLSSAGETKTPSRDVKERLAYILNTILVLNAYAVCLGIDDRVSVPGLADLEASQWMKYLKVDAKETESP